MFAFAPACAARTLFYGTYVAHGSITPHSRSCSQTYAGSGRRARVTMAATTPQTRPATGNIEVHGDTSELAVGDSIVIEYVPTKGSPMLDDEQSTLLWTGGFNGWRGESADDQTLHFPFTPLLNGRFRVSICIPEYAKTIDFCVTSADGWAWDDNQGQFFSIPVKYRKRRDEKGNVIEYVAGEDEQVHRDAKVEEEQSPVLLPEEERTLHRVRGEAALVGEEKGLGNILISQARDAFDRYDKMRTGSIARENVGNALVDLGFEDVDVELLLGKFVKEEQCTMVEFMLIYAELELSDHGLDFV